MQLQEKNSFDGGADHATIVPRRGLDFVFDKSIPRYWFGGDPFRTRFFDACSLRFPAGERFFVQCVRDFAGGIQCPQLTKEVKDFIFQEGQHSMEHASYNERLEAQGMPVQQVDERSRGALDLFRRILPKKFTLALTAAGEHMTAITAHGFFERGDRIFAGADERVVALFAWHGAEEIEHKAVALRVLRESARVGYLLRVMAMVYISIQFFLHTFFVMQKMFNADRLPLRKLPGLWLRGLYWVLGPNGLYAPMLRHYLQYYRPSFDPWKSGDMRQYHRWRTVLEKTGDPVQACTAIMWPQRAAHAKLSSTPHTIG